MIKRALTLLIGTFLLGTQAFAQQKVVTGTVTNEAGAPMAGVQVGVRATSIGTVSARDGTWSLRVSEGQVLLFRLIGSAPEQRTVGTANVINVQLKQVATSLNALVVTALGQTTIQRSLGTSQQTVDGSAIAQTQRENFVNSLQGRVAGVEVTSSSGVPGASTSITIRGVSSISGSNQPLMIIDGLPLDNKTLSSGVLASDNPTSGIAFSNRFVDFTNRAADLNPEDIESIVVLKGPEASALYGIAAGNGAIVITTKRGKPGTAGFEYSNSFRIDRTSSYPALQRAYGPTTTLGTGTTDFTYYGAPYAPGTPFYDNVAGFFRTSLSQKHNLSFSGAAPDNRINYRVSVSDTKQQGVVPNSAYERITLMGATQGVINSWLKADASLTYSYNTNDQPFKSGSSPGYAGPLIGLLIWPQTDNAKDWLTPAGQRRRLTLASAATETDNPYFSVNKNKVNAVTNRILTNVGFAITPFHWATLKTNIGIDAYANNNLIVRNPESASGFANNGALDLADNLTRNIAMQTLLMIHSVQLPRGVSVSGLLGNAITDKRDNTDAQRGLNFLDPTFNSINNTDLTTRFAWSNLFRSRVVSAFGSATVDYNRYLYVTVTGRNDWTSTIPPGRNSFFYPSVNSAFIFSDAFPSIARFVTGKLRGGWAEVGKDAQPYSYQASLESKTTTGGGYGYGFTGPNPLLKPEFATSKEIGVELNFLDDRAGLDVTAYRKETRDQIIQNARGSYATGFVLMNLNGATTRTQGWEVTLRGTPYLKGDVSWDVMLNWMHVRGVTISLPDNLPEAYNSDTWLYGNVRNGTMPGQSIMSLTGTFYLRNNKGQLLIDPTSGLPLRSSVFIDRGYDRQPNWTMGLSNTFHYKKASLNFLLDFRRGGDVFNATDHFLTVRGLAERTADREVPRVVPGVLRDGRENTGTPTVNNIVVIPAQQNAYYTGMSEELFIEKNINWVRLKDVTFQYEIPGQWLGAHAAFVWITGTDLFLKTNYTGLDPIVNANTAATNGSGGVGIDFGNFPTPRGLSFGLRVAY
jgi:TonB-linked SusC/RagA family outer membrane protein